MLTLNRAPSGAPRTASTPSYYLGHGGLQPRDVIRDWGLGFDLGNAVKYILRAGRKNLQPSADLKKALDYVQLVSIDLAANRELAEWSGNRAPRLAPETIAMAFGVSPNLAAALRAICDLSNSPSFADVWIGTAEIALRSEIANVQCTLEHTSTGVAA
jgi:hypothetical protein